MGCHSCRSIQWKAIKGAPVYKLPIGWEPAERQDWHFPTTGASCSGQKARCVAVQTTCHTEASFPFLSLLQSTSKCQHLVDSCYPTSGGTACPCGSSTEHGLGGWLWTGLPTYNDTELIVITVQLQRTVPWCSAGGIDWNVFASICAQCIERSALYSCGEEEELELNIQNLQSRQKEGARHAFAG